VGYKKFKTQPSASSVPLDLWDSCPASDSAEICAISLSHKELMLSADPSGQTLVKTNMAILAKSFCLLQTLRALYLNAGKPQKSISYIKMFEKKRLMSQEVSWLFPLRITVLKHPLCFVLSNFSRL